MIMKITMFFFPGGGCPPTSGLKHPTSDPSDWLNRNPHKAYRWIRDVSNTFDNLWVLLILRLALFMRDLIISNDPMCDKEKALSAATWMKRKVLPFHSMDIHLRAHHKDLIHFSLLIV